MKKYALSFTLFSLMSLMLAGCGGGGSSSSSTAPVVPTYTVSGSVSGLTGSATVSLSNNGSQTISSGNGSFTFSTGLDNGAAYSVTATPSSGIVCQVSNGSGTISSANVSSVTVECLTVQPVVMACGTETNIGSTNVAPLVVDGFPCANGGTAQVDNTFNEPYTSMKICAPGSTTNCQVIDHVIVDSGSTGVRVAASVLQSSLQAGGTLPAVAGSATSTSLVECELYVSSYVYGPVVKADVYIAGKVAHSVNIQVFGGSNYPVPTGCSSQGGTSTNTTQSFGGNGLIGVSFDPVDQEAYFDCQNSSLSNCSTNNVYAGLPNLVEQFSTDNNGVVMTLPAVGATGSLAPVVGSLIFGVSTQSNNTPSTPTVAVTNDTYYGTFALTVGGQWYTAYIDSGTEINYFNDTANSNLVACTEASGFQGLYCPTTDQAIVFGLANTGSQAQLGTLNYSVTSATSASLPGADVALSNLAGPIGSSNTSGSTTVAIGLSSFFGHSMYFLFNGQTAPGTNLGSSSSTPVTGPINAIK